MGSLSAAKSPMLFGLTQEFRDGEPMIVEPGGERTISASELKAKCLEVMDEVAASGQELVITKDGQPVLRLVPYGTRPEKLFGIATPTTTQ